MAKIKAYPQRDSNLYALHGKTYHKREQLKAGGARWSPEGRYWLASRELAESVGADIMMRVRIAAHCHEPEQVIFVSHQRVKRGHVRLGCGMCDTSHLCGDDVEILEILETG